MRRIKYLTSIRFALSAKRLFKVGRSLEYDYVNYDPESLLLLFLTYDLIGNFQLVTIF